MDTGAALPSSRQLSMAKQFLTRNLTQRYADQAELQQQLASGKKLRRSSDDPTAFGIARRLDTVVRQYDQYSRSIEAAVSWTNNTQDTLDSVADLLTSVYEEGVRGANDTMDADDRSHIASRLDIMLGELVDRLNTKTADGYIFAGTNTQEKPFVLDNAVGSDAAGVSYKGNSGVQERAVGIELRMDVGIPGSRMNASGSTFTGAVAGLRDALLADDVSSIRTALDDVVAVRDQAISLTAESGVAAERLADLSRHIGEMDLRIKEQRSSIEDADLAQTVSDLQKSQFGLQAALRAVASVQQTTILNYLR